MSATKLLGPTRGPLDVPDGRELQGGVTLGVSKRISGRFTFSGPSASLGCDNTGNKVAPGAAIEPIATSQVSDGAEQVGDAMLSTSTDPPSVPGAQLSNGTLDFLGTSSNYELDEADLRCLDSGAADDDFSITTIFWAAINGRKRAIEIVLQHGTGFAIILDPPRKKSRITRHFSKAQRLPTKQRIAFILNSCTSLPVYIESESTHSELYEWTTVLHWAVRKNNPPLLRRALERGASVDQLDSRGYTALHWAAWEDDEAATRTLLEYGASVRARDYYGNFPLFYAVTRFTHTTDAVKQEKYNPPWMIWLLLENEPNRNFRENNFWKTPLLHQAAIFAHKVLITDLLDPFYEGGAVDINIRDTLGRTALHLVAEADQKDIVLLLLDKGADIRVRDNYMKTAFNYAPKGGEVARLLAALEEPGYQPLVRSPGGAFTIPNN